MMYRTWLLRRVAGCLALSGFLAGCGAEGVQSSPKDSPESTSGAPASAESRVAKGRMPKVNPNWDKRGIKGKYAD